MIVVIPGRISKRFGARAHVVFNDIVHAFGCQRYAPAYPERLHFLPGMSNAPVVGRRVAFNQTTKNPRRHGCQPGHDAGQTTLERDL